MNTTKNKEIKQARKRMRIEKSKRQSAEVEESGLDTYENRNRAMEDLAVPLDVHAMISSGQLAFEP